MAFNRSIWDEMHKKDSKSVMDTEENEWVGIRSGRSGTRFAQHDEQEETIILRSYDEKRRRFTLHYITQHYSWLEKEIMQGTVPGVRKQGRPKMRWIDDVEKRKKMQFEKVLRETEYRWRWSDQYPFCISLTFIGVVVVCRSIIFCNKTNYIIINPRNEDGSRQDKPGTKMLKIMTGHKA